MNRSLVSVLALFVLLALTAIAPASADGLRGIDVNCTSGAHISNGVEVMVNMRPGYTYTATAIGLDGFDPVLAVLDARGDGLCADDDGTAARYSADLPSTGFVPSSSLSSQISFSPDTFGFADISLVVGGYNGEGGEFLLVLEGMGVTSHDGSGAGAGDPFYIRVTENMLNSGTPITAYMISLNTQLDPYMSILDGDRVPVMVCDDAGTTSCDGQSAQLNGYYISQYNGNRLGGYEYDSMVRYNLDGTQLNSNPESNYLGFLMTSYQQRTYGQYMVAFHMGTASL